VSKGWNQSLHSQAIREQGRQIHVRGMDQQIGISRLSVLLLCSAALVSAAMAQDNIGEPAGEPGYVVSSAGTTAVWATENTREGIWNAMMSKEVYGTSGTLIRLRVFGGQDMPAHPLSDLAKSPNFAVWALKDPESGNLDRIQIVKVWPNPQTGHPMEKVYDIAWSDMENRKPGEDGKLRPVGYTVDIATATYTNDIGDSQLLAEWSDPDFDPTVPVAYYVRVLEIPTPRWSTYDAVKLGVAPPAEVPATIQERAWSSPIWYTPSPELREMAAEQGIGIKPVRHASPSNQ